MALHYKLGKEGETAAVNYLKERSFRILHLNWRYGHLELDIVAQKDDELIVIEVKTRSGNWDSPESAVTGLKISRIVTATDCYIKHFDIDLPVRFDVICITGSYPNFQIEHIEDAFYPPMNVY
ncbi:MAG: YraN family protein [Dysgonamonadaceae bacterium]|jgi:putative endonuclease|nr:YraN family protein [Dysgonamonadaceae bacterium]